MSTAKRASVLVIGTCVGVVLLAWLGRTNAGIAIPMASKTVGSQPMAKQNWSGGFIDSTDKAKVQEWAQGVCRGVKFQQAAALLKTEPTVGAIAKGLIGDVSDDRAIQRAALSTCEVELRKANTEPGAA